MVIALRAACEGWCKRENEETRKRRVIYFGRDTRRARPVKRSIINVLHAYAYRVCKNSKFRTCRIAPTFAGYCVFS